MSSGTADELKARVRLLQRELEFKRKLLKKVERRKRLPTTEKILLESNAVDDQIDSQVSLQASSQKASIQEHNLQSCGSLSLFDLDSLTYCGEGNNTIVVSHVSEGCIIRIHKSDGQAKGHRERKSLSSLTQVAANPHIYRCFGSAFTRQMHLVQTTPSFLKKLEQKIAPCRPEYRRVKGIDHSELLVIVAPDAARIPPSLSGYSYGSAICVEIKPKFGAFFLWPSTDSVHTVKSSSGLFCLRQNHSTKQSRWQQLSNYCPCDLFSGDRSRMARSLWALLDTPQINLRIHLDTQLIFSYEVDRLDKGLDSFFWDTKYKTCDGINELNGFNGVCENGCSEKSVHKCKKNRECPFTNDRDRLIRGLLLDALLHELNSEDDSSAPISLYPGDRVAFSMNCRFHRALRRAQYPQLDASKFSTNGGTTTTSSEQLPPDGSILGRVLATQLLSRVDICFVVPHYERVCECLIANGLTWDDFVGLADSDRTHLLGDSPELVESFDIVEKYLISLVARDCSIMICLRRALPGCPDWVPTVGNTCACVPRMIMNAVIIDLDPKPLKKIRGRLSVEESIVHQTLAQHPWLLGSD